VQADVDGVDVVALEQLAEVGVDLLNAKLLGGRARARLVDVRGGDDLHVVAGSLAYSLK
jgi:hypothetical protein